MRPLAFALCHLLTCVLTKILRPWDTPQLSKQFVFDLIDDSNDNILLFEGLQAVCKTLGLRRIESNQLCKVFVKFIDGFFPIWEDRWRVNRCSCWSCWQGCSDCSRCWLRVRRRRRRRGPLIRRVRSIWIKWVRWRHRREEWMLKRGNYSSMLFGKMFAGVLTQPVLLVWLDWSQGLC